jgi:hypothetical protein
MSAWRLCLSKLHAHGRPMRAPHVGSEGDRRQLIAYGLATAEPGGGVWMYSITPLGIEVATERVFLSPGPRSSGTERWRWSATWLKALPQPVEVRRCIPEATA